MKLRDAIQEGSRLFLKSEYGPLSDFWPVMSFSRPQMKTFLNRHYRSASDFIIYTGTSGEATDVPEHRGRLLSVLRIDLSRSYRTADVVPTASWEWAQKHYPGQWEYAFGVLEGWSITPPPLATDIVPSTYPKMGRHPHRGMVVEVDEQEREALLDLHLTTVHLAAQPAMRAALTIDAILRDPDLNSETKRIADLIFNRVDASGSLQQRIAPLRDAPTNLWIQVAEKLREVPLICALCGGVISIRPSNRMLQPSADRIDSRSGSYGPDNFQLAHLACNLAKNNASMEQFAEWLRIVKSVSDSDTTGDE